MSEQQKAEAKANRLQKEFDQLKVEKQTGEWRSKVAGETGLPREPHHRFLAGGDAGEREGHQGLRGVEDRHAGHPRADERHHLGRIDGQSDRDCRQR
ncbi:hypothetical protein JS531_04145 [Bifidobacterium sp. CP2]|uniref:hypothetical protein n=1 Tax=Bifidobacterium TaxID=1678 RepID=UPI001BDD0D97|nr:MULTISPECIES: hypothetical protein [Bifidobacterium]MBT1181175.1 hypothetical protein [Bifidobacterium sp. CP2]MBW3079847.1 hypothetical protein [Bifidobacterium saguinibicoloris]